MKFSYLFFSYDITCAVASLAKRCKSTFSPADPLRRGQLRHGVLAPHGGHGQTATRLESGTCTARRRRGSASRCGVVIGNHEIYGGGTPGEVRERFGLPGASWSFTHTDAHFAIVDNAKGTFADDTLAWLDSDLAAHAEGEGRITTLIVAMHIPPRTDRTRPTGPGSTTRSGAPSFSRS